MSYSEKVLLKRRDEIVKVLSSFTNKSSQDSLMMSAYVDDINTTLSILRAREKDFKMQLRNYLKGKN